MLQKANNALLKQKKRAPVCTALAVAKTTKKAKTVSLFSKGMISKPSREMIHELVKHSVPEEQANDVIHACCDAFDIWVLKGITPRLVGRIVWEGGDEPPHQICSYTLLFLLFLHFLYIADPPLCTSAPM